MLENEENKMNTENNESEVKNESNIENVETVKNDAEDSATNKATEEMFEESDFVTPPQDVEETADAAQADTVQTSETDQAQNCEAQTDEDHIKGTEGASQYRYSYIKNHQKQDHVGGDRNSKSSVLCNLIWCNFRWYDPWIFRNRKEFSKISCSCKSGD